MRATKHLCLAVLVMAVAVAPLTAGTFQATGLDDLVRSSSAAVEGEVLTTSSYWDAEGRVIVTEASIHVQDLVFGESASVLRVKTFGGTVGRYTVQAPGFPTFERGERVFLFVKPDEGETDMLRVTGYQQGQFRILPGEDNVLRAESAVDGGGHLVDLAGQTKRLPAELPLSELKELVRQEAEVMRAEQQQSN